MLLRSYHAAIDRRDYAALALMFAPQAAYVSNGVGSLEGREAILSAFRTYFENHPDHRSGDDLVERVAPDAAKSVWWIRATDIRTGAPVSRRGEEIIRFDAAGRIVRVEVIDA